ncbi:MAG: hypothetical protein HONBIEJF_00043 [Fimbriimonadaceae bacterium]|nr:hypothetical protein [Fimbriimonadaceae bacterium]
MSTTLALFIGASMIGLQQQPAQEPGTLVGQRPDGKPVLCPLESTRVHVDIAGFGARVTVVQKFKNSSAEPLEAVYTFPLPADAAVDSMRMKVGSRLISGSIKRREEAKAIYDAARNQGKTAALLDQERPNIFTQSIANLMPREPVEVEISYVQLLPYKNDEFEFVYPMVVAPRFNPKSVKDADKVSPPLVKRSGATISLTVNLDAGAPIKSMTSVLHQVNVTPVSQQARRVELKKRDEIPNRDFILRYGTSGEGIQGAFLTHADSKKGGFFSLVLLPPKQPKLAQIRPRELVFVMDQSGSQNGFPLEKSKELTLKMVDQMRPGDTFNVIAFSNGARKLWTQSKPNSPANRAEAAKFVGALEANGGTQFLPAIEMSLEPPMDSERLKLVVFNTDGLIGNEAEILQEIKKRRENSRMFTFGIGNGVNRFLIDAMSAEGRGAAEFVTLNQAAEPAVQRFLARTQTPILTNIGVQFDGVQVQEVVPNQPKDVFDGEPIVIFGRYRHAGHGKVKVSGMLGDQPWEKTIDVSFPATDQQGSAIASLWARRKIDDLTQTDYIAGLTNGHRSVVADQVTSLGLTFGIMTQWTSFVAVDERIVNVGGKMRKVRVPVDLTDGLSESYFLGMDSSGYPAGGFGGGGLGGGGGAGPGSTQSKAFTRGAVITGNRRGILAGVPPESEKELEEFKAEAREKAAFESRVAASLKLSKKTTLSVQIWVTKLTPELLKKLQAAGLKVGDTDKGLRLVFGEIAAAKLRKLAMVEGIRLIEEAKP